MNSNTPTIHLQETIRNFVIEKFPLSRKRGISVQDDLLQTGILDSLGILDLVAFIEQTYGIVVSDEELVPENFRSVELLSSFVQTKSTQQPEVTP